LYPIFYFIFRGKDMSKILKKMSFLKIIFFGFFVVCCAPALSQALELDPETEALVIESIDLAMSQGSALKDPMDGQPLTLIYSEMVALGRSVILNQDLSATTYEYAVSVPFETLGGDQGALLCQAKFKQAADEVEVLKAVCILSQSFSVDEGVVQDEP
jgi:hypothetical protein